MMSPRGTLRHSAISLLRASFPRPEKSMSRLRGVRVSDMPVPLLGDVRIVALLGPSFLDLGRHTLGERAGRYVAVHHRARAGVRAVTHLDRSTQDGVGANVRALADLRAVLALTVVVRCDSSGADVGVFAHLDVAEVREVGGFCGLADLGVLRLDEVADVHAGAQARP